MTLSKPTSGHDPALPAITRRALMLAAPALAAPVAVSAGGVPLFDVVGEPEPVEAQSTIVRLFRQWEALLVKHEEDYRAAEAQAEALGTRMDFKWEEEIRALTDPERYRVEDAILAEPPTTVQDLAIKVLVNSGEGSWALDDALTIQVAALAGRDFAKLPACLFDES